MDGTTYRRVRSLIDKSKGATKFFLSLTGRISNIPHYNLLGNRILFYHQLENTLAQFTKKNNVPSNHFYTYRRTFIDWYDTEKISKKYGYSQFFNEIERGDLKVAYELKLLQEDKNTPLELKKFSNHFAKTMECL